MQKGRGEERCFFSNFLEEMAEKLCKECNVEGENGEGWKPVVQNLVQGEMGMARGMGVVLWRPSKREVGSVLCIGVNVVR